MFSRCVTVLLLTVFLALHGTVHGLAMDYYIFTCPFAELIVKSAVRQALSRDPTLAAGLLRLHFHDCFVQGCDGSVLIDPTSGNPAEKSSPANLSLRGFEIIDAAKQLLEAQCPGTVSCADILAMAAREAVFFAGGPLYGIAKGRKDGTRSRVEDTASLPRPDFNASSLIRVFGQHGFSAQEMVALAGAHTLGVARCSSFKNRFSGFDSTHEIDPSLDSNFAGELIQECRSGDNAAVALDDSHNNFDNDYFGLIQIERGLLFSDQSLYSTPSTRGAVDGYASNEASFFSDFQQAMVKMGSLDVKEDDDGEVRLNCRRIN